MVPNVVLDALIMDVTSLRRPATGMKSLQKIVQMAFFSTGKQPCQSYSTKVTNDDVGGWTI